MCRLVVTDHRPIDHDLLLQDAGPFDERNGDAAVWAATNRLNHSRVGKSRRVSRTLQIEFRLVHATRNVGGQHEKEIDTLGGAARSPTCRRHQRADHEGSYNAHYVGIVLLYCEQLDCYPSCRSASNPNGEQAQPFSSSRPRVLRAPRPRDGIEEQKGAVCVIQLKLLSENIELLKLPTSETS
jgi:hypothetical protein